MLYTLHYTTDLFHICKIQWNIIKDEMRWGSSTNMLFSDVGNQLPNIAAQHVEKGNSSLPILSIEPPKLKWRKVVAPIKRHRWLWTFSSSDGHLVIHGDTDARSMQWFGLCRSFANCATNLLGHQVRGRRLYPWLIYDPWSFRSTDHIKTCVCNILRSMASLMAVVLCMK